MSHAIQLQGNARDPMPPGGGPGGSIQQSLVAAAAEFCRPVRLATYESRDQIRYRNEGRDFNKQQSVEPNKWVCENCGVLNFVRTDGYGEGLVITPRVVHCHNSRCGWRKLYWRDDKNHLFARHMGTEEVDELEFVSKHDPVKFYDRLVCTVEEPGEWDDDEGLTECPNCGQEYDDADADFYICHHCGFNANEKKEDLPF